MHASSLGTTLSRTRLDVWDRAALGLSVYTCMGVVPVSSGLDFLAPRPVFRTSADDRAYTAIHTGTSP